MHKQNNDYANYQKWIPVGGVLPDFSVVSFSLVTWVANPFVHAQDNEKWAAIECVFTDLSVVNFSLVTSVANPFVWSRTHSCSRELIRAFARQWSRRTTLFFPVGAGHDPTYVNGFILFSNVC